MSHVINRWWWIAVECFNVCINVFRTTQIQLFKLYVELTLGAPLVLGVIYRQEDCRVHEKTVFIEWRLAA